MRFCAQCGEAVTAADAFCTSCGHRLAPPPPSTDQLAKILGEQADAAEQAADQSAAAPLVASTLSAGPAGPVAAAPAPSAPASPGIDGAALPPAPPASPAPPAPAAPPAGVEAAGIAAAEMPPAGTSAPIVPPASALPPAAPSAAAVALSARTEQLRRLALRSREGLTSRPVLGAAAAGAAAVVGPFLVFWGLIGLAMSRSELGQVSDTSAIAALNASGLLGMGLGVPMTGEVAGSVKSFGSGGVQASSSIMLLTLTLLLAVVLAVAVRVAQRSVAATPQQAPALGLISAGAFAIGSVLLVVVSRVNQAVEVPELGSVSVASGVDPLRSALSALVLGAAVASVSWWHVAADRADRRIRDRIKRLPADWYRAVALALPIVALPVLLGSVIVVVASAYRVATSSSDLPVGGFSLGVAFVLAVVNAAVLAGGALIGGSLFASAGAAAATLASGSVRFGLISGGLPTRIVVLCVTSLVLMVLLLGLRTGLRSAPRRLSGAVAWRTVALVAGCWFVLAKFVRVTVDVNASGSLPPLLARELLGTSSIGASMHTNAGLGYPSILVGSLVFTLLVLVCGWLLTPQVAGLAPRWALRLAGSGIDAGWVPLLQAAAAQRGESALPVAAVAPDTNDTPTAQVAQAAAVAAAPVDPTAPVAPDAQSLPDTPAVQAEPVRTSEPVPASQPIPVAEAAAPQPLATQLTMVDPRARLALLVCGALLALGVLGLGAKAAYGRLIATPTNAAAGYLDAVAAKDAAAALGRLDPASKRDLDTTLLTSQAMGELPKYTLTEISADDDHATIRVAFEQNGVANGSVPTNLLLHRTDGPAGTPVWHVTNGLGSLGVDAGSGVDPASVTVNGVPASSGQHPAFPGRYTASGKSLPLSAVKEDSSFVGVGSRSSLSVGAVIPEQYTKAIETAIKAHVDECVAKGRSEAPGCPFSTYGSYSSLTWSVTQYPVVQATLDQNVIRVRSQQDGQVAYTGVGAYASSASRGTDRFGINGTVSWDGKAESPIRFTPDH
jgi:hypothetical protein